MEEVEQLPKDSTASFNVTQTLDHTLDAQLLGDLNKQSTPDSLDDTLTNDKESKYCRADSCETVLQTSGEQSYEATDEVGITLGAKFKNQPNSSSSSLRQPTHSAKKPQNVPSTRSVPSMHGKEHSRTSMNETNTILSNTADASDDECCAGKDGAVCDESVYDESSHDLLFPRRREMQLKSSSKLNSYEKEDGSDTENPGPLRSSNQNRRPANYQSSPNEKEVEREAEVLERKRRTRQREKDRRRD